MPKFDNPTQVDLDDRYEYDRLSVREILGYIASDPVLIEIARKAIEDQAIEMRDMRAGVMMGNGITVAERDGATSDVIRIWTPDAVVIALKAIAEVSGNELAEVRERYRQAREAREQ